MNLTVCIHGTPTVPYMYNNKVQLIQCIVRCYLSVSPMLIHFFYGQELITSTFVSLMFYDKEA
jgi:hypothetical protein